MACTSALPSKSALDGEGGDGGGRRGGEGVGEGEGRGSGRGRGEESWFKYCNTHESPLNSDQSVNLHTVFPPHTSHLSKETTPLQRPHLQRDHTSTETLATPSHEAMLCNSTSQLTATSGFLGNH